MTTTRPCDVCGQPYTAKRPSSRYCGDTCRQRARRAGISNEPPTVTLGGVDGPVAAATAAALEATGMLDSPIGQSTVALARRMDANADTGAGLASLSRELRAALAEALADVTVAADPLDELRARREARRGA